VPVGKTRVCRKCERTLPLDHEHFYRDRKCRDGFKWRCRTCEHESQRRENLPPEVLEHRRKVSRESARRRRAEGSRSNAEASRRWREKTKQDPAKWRAMILDSQKIRARLRAEREGREIRTVRVAADERKDGRKVDAQEFPKLPAAALLAWITERIRIEDRARRMGLDNSARDTGARGDVCARLGVDLRRVYSWEVGEAERVDFNLADRILTRGGVCWWDVWDASNTDEHGLRLVARAFEGDPDAAEQLDLWETAA
jgi:hypothetical protein